MWHVLGLGYDPNVEPDDIQGAAVVHYNGNMKPWLELAMSKYKSYWNKYVNYNDYFFQGTGIGLYGWVPTCNYNVTIDGSLVNPINDRNDTSPGNSLLFWMPDGG